MEPFGISIFQPDAAAETPAARLSWLDIAAERAAEKGSSMLICPELYLLGGLSVETVADRAETATGEYADRTAEIAYLHDISLVYGYPEIDGDNVFNAISCVSPDGVVLANHRKNNLNPGVESAIFTAGDRINVFAQFGWKIALFHDAELELPDMAHAATLAGAEVFIVASSLRSDRPIAPANILSTRAFENRAYLVFANFADPTGEAGVSCVIDPTGQSLVKSGEVPELISERLEPLRLQLARKGIPFGRDHRPFKDSLY